MRPWLPALDFFDDAEPHSAGYNMAADEALLGVARRPLLRVYRWVRPAVSFGYFDRWEPIPAAYPGREAVRRWTGGGVVPHGRDFTYSLVIPNTGATTRRSPGESYAVIHQALSSALAGLGIDSAPVFISAGKTSPACFENPVRHDVLAQGRKIAGAAQRRTRLGLLHQGSVQGVELPADFGKILANQLAAEVSEREYDIQQEATALAEQKYASPEWTRRIL